MTTGSPTPQVLSRAAARELDRLAAEEYAIPTILLMENAAAAAARCAMALLEDVPAPVLILAGPGNNGGDGLAMARHLHNAGCPVAVSLRRPPHAGTDAETNRIILLRMGLPVAADPVSACAFLPGPPSLVVDAIFGTGLTRAVCGDDAADFATVAGLRGVGVLVLSLDTPSGLDCDTGRPMGLCIEADATVTFAGLKRGFLNPEAARYLGCVTVADIGLPRELIERVTDS